MKNTKFEVLFGVNCNRGRGGDSVSGHTYGTFVTLQMAVSMQRKKERKKKRKIERQTESKKVRQKEK